MILPMNASGSIETVNEKDVDAGEVNESGVELILFLKELCKVLWLAGNHVPGVRCFVLRILGSMKQSGKDICEGVQVVISDRRNIIRQALDLWIYRMIGFFGSIWVIYGGAFGCNGWSGVCELVLLCAASTELGMTCSKVSSEMLYILKMYW